MKRESGTPRLCRPMAANVLQQQQHRLSDHLAPSRFAINKLTENWVRYIWWAQTEPLVLECLRDKEKNQLMPLKTEKKSKTINYFGIIPAKQI